MKTVLKNGTIFDGVRWNEKADILVENGVIIDVGGPFEAEQTVDLNGYSILPGVIDAHMHILTGDVPYSDFALKGWAQAGVTTLRDLGLGNPKPVEDFLAYRDSVDGPECAHCLTCGRFVTAYHGYSHIMPDGNENGIGIQTAQEGIDAVNSLIDLGCDGIKTAVDLSMMAADPNAILDTEKLKAIADAAKARGVWCCVHVLKAEYLERILDAGIPELAHVPTDRISDELIDRMIAQKVSLVPTLCTINEERPPLENEGGPVGPGGPDGMPGGPGGMPGGPMISGEEQEKIAIDNVARFFQKGGLVAVGTDAMRMETRPASVAMPLKEFKLLYKAMGSVREVIKAATINAAAVCGLADSIGTLEPGKQANIIAVKSALNESFEALGHVEFVMNRGVIIKNS